MELNKKIIMSAVLCCLMFLVESCSSSSLVDEWNDSSYHGTPLKKIFVIAIRKNPIQRQIWEDAFVSELSKHGTQATSSYHLFPNVLPDTNQIIQAVQEKGFDGILVTRHLPAETESHYVEGYSTTEIASRYNFFRKRYDTYFRDIQNPGYVESQVIYRRAIDVWVIRGDEQMIWSAISNSPDRNTVEDVENDIAELVIPALTRNTIIKSGR